MAEPLVFHYSVDSRGFPCAMTICDLEIECPVCKNVVVQRYFDALPLHPITLEKLVAHATDVAAKCKGDCVQCGSPLNSPEHTVATAVTWGFDDDTGVLRIVYNRRNEVIKFYGHRRYRLDPQAVPNFGMDDREVELFGLTEHSVYELFGRYFSIKKAILQGIEEAWNSRTVVKRDLTPSMQLIAQRTENIDESAITEPTLGVSWLRSNLVESSDFDLPTQPYSREIAGRASTWLGPNIWDKIVSGDITVNLDVDVEAVSSALQRVLTTGLISYDALEDGLINVVAPNGEPLFPKVEEGKTCILRFSDIAHRCIYTGISPEAAARLTGEEIIANFLRVDRTI